MALLPTALPRQVFARGGVERVIAIVRVVTAASSLFAVWLVPSEPLGHVQFTYALHAAYLGYALVVTGVMWRRDPGGLAPLVTHVVDILIASVLQYMTLGPSSPFYTYFVYALFCAALRWGWRGTVRTAAVVLGLYVVIGVSLSQTLDIGQFDLNRFVVRTTYLVVVSILLVYLGQHEAWLRDEIQRLASWPVPRDEDWARGVPRILEHAAGIAGAGRAMVVWSIEDEPHSFLSAWPGDVPIVRYPPGSIDPVVAMELTDSTFVSRPGPGDTWAVSVRRSAEPPAFEGPAVHPALVTYLAGAGFASAPFRTNQLSGRAFFSSMPATGSEVVPLVEVLAREIGSSLDHLQSHQRSQELAVAEERIRVARNLHDGVLQALTGIRLELQRMAAQERQAAAPPAVGGRLLAIERALSIEQRELRSFIEDLKPSPPPGADSASIASRLDELRRRLSAEWQTPITIRISPEQLSVPPGYDLAVPLMVHEAVVNALKHGKPTRVAVDVHADDEMLHIAVSDDGTGFPFNGRRDYAALVADNTGPVSLRERIGSLGGEISVESSAAGSRVELAIPLGAVHA